MNRHASCVRLLLDAGADPSATDNEGYAPIHNAARNGDIEIVTILIDAGADVNTPLVGPAEDEGETALNTACYAGHIGLVRVLNERGACDSGILIKDTIIGAYERSEDPIELVQYLTENVVQQLGSEAVLTAGLVAPVATFKLLLDIYSSMEGIDPGQQKVMSKALAKILSNEADEQRRDEIGRNISAAGYALVDDELDLAEFGTLSIDERLQRSPLWTAVTAGDAEAALKLAQDTVGQWALVDEPAGISGIQNITPLAMASGQQLPAFLELLIKEGADIDAMDSVGFVPLTYALQGEKLDNFRLLINEGANPDPLNKGVGRYSPLAMAADHGLAGVVSDLIERGVDVNWVDARGGDALKVAAAKGQLECVELLIDAGANPASFDDEGYSPIHNAVDEGHHDVVMKLLDAGVDIDLRVKSPSDDEGSTVLHRACVQGDLELVRMLVDRGGSVNSVSAGSSTPLSSAIAYSIENQEDTTELVQYLIKHGAEPDLRALFFALQGLPVPIFTILLKKLLPKMDSPLPIEDTELDKDGITNAFTLFLNEESDMQRRNDIQKVLKDAGLDIPSME